MHGEQAWTLVAAGDAIVTHRLDHLMHDEAFAQIVRTVQAADVASVNLEVCVFAEQEFTGWPAAQCGGGYLVGSPRCLADLAAVGFNLFARGNNHAMDFGIEGLHATDQSVDRLGLLHAGTGRHLAEAARAVYLETAAGRVAMVSFATTFPVSAKAGEQRHDTRGRPGVNGVTVERTLAAPADLRRALETVAAGYGRPTLWAETNLALADADEPSLHAAPNSSDVARIVRSIEVAASFADVVIVNAHSHEPSNPVLEVPDWFRGLAATCIDAGAHAFLGHGPHQLRGFEVYRDRPIFYSLGNFVCHRDAHDPIPADQYTAIGLDGRSGEPDGYVAVRDSGNALLNMTDRRWHESVLPTIEFRGAQLVGVRLTPLDLDAGAPPGRRGNPRVATGEHAEEILQRQAELAAPFGVSVDPVSGSVVW